jgi:hypothetical protein
MRYPSPARVREVSLRLALDAGCPWSQIENFGKGEYIPLPERLAFHAACRRCDEPGGPDEIGLGGTRGSAKSHTVLAQIGLDDCQRFPGLKVLWLRKIMKSASESLEDLTRKVLHSTEHVFASNRIDFPNGSRILVGGFKDEKDIDKYLGIEYDIIAIEEACQISEKRRDAIQGSCRSTKMGWRARMYYTTNPDGIGVAWFKRRLVIPWREGKETITRYFPASWEDNPFLDDAYIRYLNNLTGQLRKAWRDADWDAFQGMAFPNWNYDRHVLELTDRRLDIPFSWTWRRAADYGYSAPWACLWIAKDPDNGRRIIMKEGYETYLTDSQQAQKIVDMTGTQKIAITWADPAMWARKNSKTDKDNREVVTSSADEYKAKGVVLTQADNDRINGWRKVRRILSDLPDGEPGLLVAPWCVEFIRTFPELPSDKFNPEDVDSKAEDHLADCLRYDCTDQVSESMIPPAPKVKEPDRWSGMKHA